VINWPTISEPRWNPGLLQINDRAILTIAGFGKISRDVFRAVFRMIQREFDIADYSCRKTKSLSENRVSIQALPAQPPVFR